MTLTFDLLTSKWVTRVMGFFPVNFSFLCPSVLDLWSDTGKTGTDTRTVRQRLSMHYDHYMGVGHNNIVGFVFLYCYTIFP